MRRLLPRILLALATALPIGAAHATAPMARSPAPGFYRIMVGDIEVTPLSDGTVDLTVDRVLHQDAALTRARLERDYLALPLETSVNAYLVNTGSRLVLIDAGAGVLFGRTLGRLPDNLRAAGYLPDQVDEIYITHLHADHVGGLVSEGRCVFPNAIVRAGKADADYWLNQAQHDAGPAARQRVFENAKTALAPYVQSGKFKPIDVDGELVPGVSAIAANGHTPGHTVYLVESRGRKLLLIGDLIHVAAVQFEKPQVTIASDTDEDAARASRKKVFDEAARDGLLVGGAHLQFPGLGHLAVDGSGYRWIPLREERPR